MTAPELLRLAAAGCDCQPPDYCGNVTCVDYPVPREVWDPSYRRKPAPKPPEELTAIRAKAWATRRAKYGERGHR
jgi:hypothetical protein